MLTLVKDFVFGSFQLIFECLKFTWYISRFPQLLHHIPYFLELKHRIDLPQLRTHLGNWLLSLVQLQSRSTRRFRTTRWGTQVGCPQLVASSARGWPSPSKSVLALECIRLPPSASRGSSAWKHTSKWNIAPLLWRWRWLRSRSSRESRERKSWRQWRWWNCRTIWDPCSTPSLASRPLNLSLLRPWQQKRANRLPGR